MQSTPQEVFQLVAECEAGRLEWAFTKRMTGPEVTFWLNGEWCSGGYLPIALQNAAREGHPLAGALLSQGRIRWTPSPDLQAEIAARGSGLTTLRFKAMVLPLVVALEAAAVEEAGLRMAKVPDEFDEHAVPGWHTWPRWLQDSYLSKQVWPALGWQPMKRFDLSGLKLSPWKVEADEVVYSASLYHGTRWVRGAWTLRGEDAVDTLAAVGQPVCLGGPEAPEADIEWPNLRSVPDFPLVSLADRLAVEGVAVPFYIDVAHVEDDDPEWPALILPGTPREVVQALMNDPRVATLIGYLAWTSESWHEAASMGDHLVFPLGEPTLNPLEEQVAVAEAVVESFVTDAAEHAALLGSIQRARACHALAFALQQLSGPADQLRYWLGQVPDLAMPDGMELTEAFGPARLEPEALDRISANLRQQATQAFA